MGAVYYRSKSGFLRVGYIIVELSIRKSTHNLSMYCFGGEFFLESDPQNVHPNEQDAHLSRFYDITPRPQAQEATSFFAVSFFLAMIMRHKILVAHIHPLSF